MAGTEPAGMALVICAPSGAGKTTLVARLTQEFPGFAFSVSYTTRAPRPGEVDGREYVFVSRERFQALAAEGFFAEWAEVHGNLYGTPLQQTLDTLNSGRDMLFDIDVQGARQLRSSLGTGAFVFILPPSREVLRERLRGRASDDPEAVARRMAEARQELLAAVEFDFWILNQDLEAAYDQLRSVYLAERCRPGLNQGLLQSVLATWEK